MSVIVTTDPAQDIWDAGFTMHAHYEEAEEYPFAKATGFQLYQEGGDMKWLPVSGPMGPSTPFSASPHAVITVLPGTTYYFRAWVEDDDLVIHYGSWLSCTTTQLMTGITEPADNITENSALIKGTNPDVAGALWPDGHGFEWKKGLLGTVNTIYTAPAFITLNWPLSSLDAGTVYYYRYYVWHTRYEQAGLGEEGKIFGEWRSFITQELCIVITNPATNILNLSTQINGEMVPGWGDTFVERGFYWKKGLTGSESKEVVSLDGNIYSKVLTSLEHGTLYYFRAYGKGDSGEFYFGDWLNFTTTSIVPSGSTQIATDLEAISATGNGTIVNCGGGEPNCSERGFDIKYSFAGTLKEYDAWVYYGFVGDLTLNSGTGLWEGTIAKSYEVSGTFSTGAFTLGLDDLVCNKEFFYRAKAKNTAGWGVGGYLAFTTDELLLRKTCTCGIFTVMLCAYVNPIPLGSIIKRRGFRWGVYDTAQEYDIHEDGDFEASATIGPIDTISFVCSNDDNVYDTIVDASEGFLTAGFVAGKFIDVSATGAIDPVNEGQFKIISVTAGTITVNVRNTLVSEGVTGVTIVDLFALYIVDLDPESDYYSVAYVAIEDSEGNWTVQEGGVAMAATIANIFDFEGYDRVEFYNPEREQSYKKITRRIEAEITAEQQYIDLAGGRRFLPIKNHLIQTKANAVIVGTSYKDRFKNIKSLMQIEYPTPAPLQREDTLDIGFGRIRFKEDDKGVVNFMPDGEGLMLFRYRMTMLIRKIDMGYIISKESVDYMATMELEEA